MSQSPTPSAMPRTAPAGTVTMSSVTSLSGSMAATSSATRSISSTRATVCSDRPASIRLARVTGTRFPTPPGPTTTKTRVIADNQHVVRIDKESKDYIKESTEKKLFKFIENQINELDGIILQDYNKGVLTESLIKNVIDLANKSKKLITVDPKFENFYCYKKATVFKPNRKEAEAKLGAKIFTAEEISIAGKKLMEQLKAKYLLLTLGEEGIAIFENGKPVERMETKARKVADVSGAGDTVISTLTIAMAAGADILEACYLANYAGGLVCEEVGIVPIEQKKLFETVLKEHR